MGFTPRPGSRGRSGKAFANLGRLLFLLAIFAGGAGLGPGGTIVGLLVMRLPREQSRCGGSGALDRSAGRFRPRASFLFCTSDAPRYQLLAVCETGPAGSWAGLHAAGP